MATYAELYDLRSNSALLNRVTVAITIKAQLLIDEAAPTVDELAWAAAAIVNPHSKATELFNYVLAKNSTLTKAQIEAATDTAIQNQINAAVDALIPGA